MKKNTEALLIANKEFDLEVKAEKTVCLHLMNKMQANVVIERRQINHLIIWQSLKSWEVH